MEKEAEEEEVQEQVMSDIHLGCPPDAESHVSRFTILHNSTPLTGGSEQTTDSNCQKDEEKISTWQKFTLDKEGDLVLARRKHKRQTVIDTYDSILIHHHVTTAIPSVGLQIWRASLLLGDFILHSICTSSYFHDVVALELGAGTGLVGILVARAAKTVFITDKGVDILDNCFHNIELNFPAYKYNEKSVRVRQLNWQNSWPPKVIQAEKEFMTSPEYKYSWTSSDIDQVEEATILLAADVVYSNDLTDAFFDILHKVMPPGSKKVLFLSLEKRYNFTLEDLDIVAHSYHHFRTFFEEDLPESAGCARDHPTLRESGITTPYFIGKRLDVARIPQYIQEYDRGGDTELWEIRAH